MKMDDDWAPEFLTRRGFSVQDSQEIVCGAMAAICWALVIVIPVHVWPLVKGG